MKDEHHRLIEALRFYANRDAYWGEPIPLELNLDQRTLRIKHDSMHASEILRDMGDKARKAIEKFNASKGVENLSYET
jgi:hypothetical protein